jgi:hypothetical protein
MERLVLQQVLVHLGTKENLPTIRPQYTLRQNQPKVSLIIEKQSQCVFFSDDYLYTETLKKNEFVTRYYDNGDN